MTRKQTVRCIGFLLSVCVLLYLLCDLFEFKNTKSSDKRFNTYRSLNADTVDAVMIGTSGIDRYWIPPKAYEEYGMTVYTLATDGQPVWLYEYLIEEIYTYQNPELLIIDMRPYGQDAAEDGEMQMDARARKVLDSLTPLSVHRLKAGFKTMEFFHENYEDKPWFDISYLLSVVKYHEEWANEKYSIKDNLFGKKHEYMGTFINKGKTVHKEPHKKEVYDKDYYEPLDPVAEREFYKLVNYVKEKDRKVLFVLTPKFSKTVETGRMNTLMDMLEKEGMDYINYCETDAEGNFLYDLQLDNETDFYDRNHTNYYGAEKFTRVFAAYLKENYNLPDRREDAAVKEQWDGIYDKVKARVSKLEKQTGK